MHIDAFSSPKFDAPGHWATGDRYQTLAPPGVGKTVVIGVVDDHSRLAYGELHSGENGDTVSRRCDAPRPGCASRAAARSQAVMTDNAKCYYTSLVFRDV